MLPLTTKDLQRALHDVAHSRGLRGAAIVERDGAPVIWSARRGAGLSADWAVAAVRAVASADAAGACGRSTLRTVTVGTPEGDVTAVDATPRLLVLVVSEATSAHRRRAAAAAEALASAVRGETAAAAEAPAGIGPSA